MRMILISAILSAAVGLQAAEPVATTEQVEGFIGTRLAELVPKLGPPTDLHSWRSTRSKDERYRSGNDDCVQFGYGNYAFLANFEIVQGCAFLPGWSAAVHGVKLGDDADAVVKLLGKEYAEGKKADGTHPYYAWKLKDVSRNLWIYWDQNRKVDRIEVWNRVK